jgi:parvulin-like peptidyl-prolyl isomerase
VGIAGTALLTHTLDTRDAVAATVDGQPIMMSTVHREAMQVAGASALDQLIQFSVIDNEARNKGITITAADVNEQLQKERAKLTPPTTLDDQLKQHHMTMSQFEVILRHNLELRKMLIGSVKIYPLYHLRAIMIYTKGAGANQTGPKHTDQQAKALIAQVESDLNSGQKWDDVVTRYSEDLPTKRIAGDLGIINKVSGYDQGFTETATELKNGQISAPFNILDGYAIIQLISSGDDHPASENGAYTRIESAYEDYMVGHLVPQYVQNLQMNAKVVKDPVQ